MNQFFQYLYKRLSRKPALIISGLLMVMIYWLMHITQLPKVSQYLIELQLAFTTSRALKVIAIWGPEGIESFLNNIWLDFIFPLGYGLFLSGLIAFLASLKNATITPVNLLLFRLPLLAIPFDYIENVLHIIMLSTGLIPNPVLLFLASIVALIKWSLVTVAISAIIYLTYKYLSATSIRRKESQK